MKYKTLFLLFIFSVGCHFSHAQYQASPLPQYPKKWNAQWITHPDIDKTAHNLIHFRHIFNLKKKPEQFIVHVSGDNRYRLYVNGDEVCFGPQLGDIRHWRYETVDLSPYLKKGKNIIATEVMNWGVERSYGIISFKTGFLLQGNTDKEQFLNTNYHSDWKVLQNEGVHEKPVDWIFGNEIVGGFYAGNPTDSVVAAQYPWGWRELEYDDDHWQIPEVIFARPNANAGNGHGWILQPRTTAIQTIEIESLSRIVRNDIQSLDKNFQFGQNTLEIPANNKAKILIDQGYVTLGYPKLILSKGSNARISVKYSEALYDANNHKGKRNVTEEKKIKGISDVYVMDGDIKRMFQPMWFRTFRFIQLNIQTMDDPLLIEDFYNVYSATDFPVKAAFKTNNPIYDQIWDLCWHTMKICAQDNLMSDAYYEQMQYVGDLRPHLKGWTTLTGDLSYFKSAMQQFNNSRLPDGNITSCYPLKATFVHPTYSLIWIDMLHDLMMLEGEQESIEQYTGEIEEVFNYYESIINKNGLVGESKYPMFIDWYIPKGGNSTVNKKGNSAILTLNYVYTLKNAADIFEWLGYRNKAFHYRNQSRKYAEIVRRLCFDETRGIYADDPERTFYDQRASIMAVLGGAHTERESKLLMKKILSDSTNFNSKANLFYYFYLFEAIQKTGVGNFTQQLKPWETMIELGMSGTPEKRVEQHPRSEIHPWTAHPVHYFFSLVAGIKPAEPGFSSVDISPNPGMIKNINATFPTIMGNIILDYTFTGNGQITGNITLPGDMKGTFNWNGTSIELKPGTNYL